MVEGGATEAAPSPAGALETAVAGEVESTAGVESGSRVSVVREPNSTYATAPSKRNKTAKNNKATKKEEEEDTHLREKEKKW